MDLTADLVAAAIVAASRETGADPECVVVGVPRSGDRANQVAHARGYAAVALSKVLPDCSRESIARAVGAKSPGYIANITCNLRKQRLGWFDGESLARVVAATNAAHRLRHIVDEPRTPVRHTLRQTDAQPLTTRRHVHREAEVVTAEIMGDPAPGRSALDQRGGRA